MSFGVTETQWFSVTREEFCKKEGGKKGSEEGKKNWVKYRLCKFWLTDFNINDCHLITLKETQWFSTTRGKFLKIGRKEKIAIKYQF